MVGLAAQGERHEPEPELLGQPPRQPRLAAAGRSDQQECDAAHLARAQELAGERLTHDRADWLECPRELGRQPLGDLVDALRLGKLGQR